MTVDRSLVRLIMAIAAISLVIGMGLRLSRRGVLGSLFWTIIGCAGLVLGWLSHFSPFTDQPVHVIYGAYHAAADGALAVSA